jgi:acyl-CoA hydrolase
MVELAEPDYFTHVQKAVDRVVADTGGDIRLGLPLGLGKPNQFVNALYQRACDDERISLTIFTALSLSVPRAGSELERRFLEPFAQRVFNDYQELAYVRAQKRNALPENVTVCEFFFAPGSMLGSSDAQRHYISTNYTHVARDLDRMGVNVVAQMVASRGDASSQRFSLSCNPEVSLDLLPYLEARRRRGETVLAVAQIHEDLPYMGNDAEVEPGLFDIVIDDAETHTELFGTPNMPVGLQDHFVGLHASTLIRDGGTLQIGIGALGDALVHHALTRHHDNAAYRALLEAFGHESRYGAIVDEDGGTDTFDKGLYGCSEMFTLGLMKLIDGDVIRRRVYSDEGLQQLMNEGRLEDQVTLATLDVLMESGLIGCHLDDVELDWLLHHGVFRAPVSLDDGELLLPNDVRVSNDLLDNSTREALKSILGECFCGGILMHGGFFLGPRPFYQRLRALDESQRAAINMTRISYINHLYGEESLKRLQRRDARFINTAFSATLLGAAVSDQLDDGRVLSGVGGQYNFVSQAHELDDARSVIMLRSWRERGNEAKSNILFSYPHYTIPRHLRDIFVTEYGVADLRGKTDEQCVAAMLNIADSRFQPELLEQAKTAGKISDDYEIPEPFTHNTPQRLEEVARQSDKQKSFPLFPLGTEFDEMEQRLLSALTWLKEKASHKHFLELGRKALLEDGDEDRFQPHLERMGLARSEGLRQRLYRRLLLTALRATGTAG